MNSNTDITTGSIGQDTDIVIEQIGQGEPNIAIVSAIHGDEHSGVHAIERILGLDLNVNHPIKLVIANNKAFLKRDRKISSDLNRETGDRDRHEEKLARKLRDELAGCKVLSIHNTQSTEQPVAFATRLNEFSREICQHLSINNLVDISGELGSRPYAEGNDIEFIELESGYYNPSANPPLYGSDAANENAFRISLEFLTATGAIPGTTIPRTIDVYEMVGTLNKPTGQKYEVLVDNFQCVRKGEEFAKVDGDTVPETVAKETFWPVVFSADGYDDKFGYKAIYLGREEV